jgi:hypothetical protein
MAFWKIGDGIGTGESGEDIQSVFSLNKKSH